MMNANERKSEISKSKSETNPNASNPKFKNATSFDPGVLIFGFPVLNLFGISDLGFRFFCRA
jgi:hypothetical protein